MSTQKPKPPVSGGRLRLGTYLTIAFVEGGAVMVAELSGAKMIAPFYGTSLFVWSSVIGVTLAALASGYFAGGYLADRFTGNQLLFTVLAIGAVFIAIMPLTAQLIMEATLGAGVRIGSLISTLVFLFPPLVCMGMVSPIIIRLAARDLQHTGRTAGSVYAISTLGGILATFFTGFYAIPMWGVTMPVIFMAGVLGAFPFIYFFSRKRWMASSSYMVIFAMPFVIEAVREDDPRVLYHSEGLLGQVMVVDVIDDFEGEPYHQRVLYVNRLAQTNQEMSTGYSLWHYVHAIGTLAAVNPPGSRSLILGLGGGSLADEFQWLGFDVDGVEFDERVARAAIDYFQLDPRTKVFIDDARHFVRTTDKGYDIIVYDVFAGEQHPAHVLTLESFLEVRRILSRDGLLFINFTGYLAGERGRGTRSIVKTLMEIGFHVALLPTPGEEATRNIVIAASPAPLDFSRIPSDRQNECCRDIGHVPLPPPVIPGRQISLVGAEVLRDSRPVMDILNLPAAEAWRRFVLENYRKHFRGSAFF